MDIAYENAINFLLWSYFKLTLSDGEDADEILDVCIQKAYLDATQQGAYTALIPKDDPKLKERSSDAKTKSERKILRVAILKLCKDKKLEFDEWHSALCKTLVKQYSAIKIEEEELFSYGNAQKWVNMTLKYLYMLYPLYAACDRGCAFCETYGEMIKRYRRDFHVPVDSYIMEDIWDDPKLWEKIPGRDDEVGPFPLRKKHTGKYDTEKVIPWSQWKEPEYTDFRKKTQEKVTDSPLDWEGPTWIKIAKRRKKK